MRRTLLLVALLTAAVTLATFQIAAAPADDDERYTVVLDNAFGLTAGSDLRSSGVVIGKVTDLDVERSTARALATITVTRPEFAGLRADVFCEVRPQSLIGEYFLDCDPGKSAKPAPARIPVEQTAGTIPPDVVLDILRRPARERFGLILSELGAGFAARGEDLQTTIRRAVPALRETDEVLAILYDNRRTLNQLTRDADAVLAGLRDNRTDVARFVGEAGATASVAASRRRELQASVRRLPGFLAELRPTLADLATAAEQQAPALRDLRVAAPQLTRLLRLLGPFADAARPAVRGLGRASVTGTSAVREAASTISQLRALGASSTEPMRNLRFVLEDVNDRGRAVEPNRLSPTGGGFTGLEAFLQYVFVQSQAINIFDSKSFMLKLNLLINQCTPYVNAETAITDKQHTAACKQWLGPTQPGITNAIVARTRPARRTPARKTPSRTPDEPAQQPAAPPPPPQAAPQAPPPPPPPLLPLPDPRDLLDDLLPPNITDRLPPILQGRQQQQRSDSERTLLDFLLGP